MNLTTAVATAAATTAVTATTSVGAGEQAKAAEQAMAALMERRRRRREVLHDRTRSAASVHRADETLWPDSVANPDRVQVR